ncbi:MAG: protein kinase [Isosphaeraceae bacterium]
MSDEPSRPHAGRSSDPAKAEDLAGTLNAPAPGDATVNIASSVVGGSDAMVTVFHVQGDEAGTVVLPPDMGPSSAIHDAATLGPGFTSLEKPHPGERGPVHAETIAGSPGLSSASGMPVPDATLPLSDSRPDSTAAMTGAAWQTSPGAAETLAGFNATKAIPPAAHSGPDETVAVDSGATVNLAETHDATLDLGPHAGGLPPTQADVRHGAGGRPRPNVPDDQERCGRYVLKKFFARGGMGEVWLAEDPIIGRSVALKRMLAQSPEQQMRFRVEAQITGQLEHPGIVPIHELGTSDDGEPFYAMKFVQGRTLKAVIQDFHASNLTGGERDLQLHRLLQMFLSLCQAVAYSHSRGVIHRDLKPDNVMLGSYGETILLDWGIAKILGRSEDPSGNHEVVSTRLGDTIPDTGTHAGAIMGTPAYMAPEVAAGLNDEVDERSDIYLLGAILFELLSGQQPRTAKTMLELLHKAKNEPVSSIRVHVPHAPKALDAICLKAMAHRKEDRYATAGELADDVQRYVAGEPVSAYRESWTERAWRWARRHRTAIVRSAAALTLAGITVFGVQKLREAERLRIEASRAAEELRNREQARQDLARFHRLVDEANFFAATSEPVSEHAPYYDSARGEEASQSALALAAKWGPDLERLPMPDARAAVKKELYELLLLEAMLKERSDASAGGDCRRAGHHRPRATFSAPPSAPFQLRARAHERLGDKARAAEYLAKAADPQVVRSALDRFLQAERLHSNRLHASATRSICKPWQPDPVRMEEAIGLYREALAINPDHFWSRLQLGRCYQSLGRFAESVEALGACIAIRPEAEWGYGALGLALAQQGRLAEAESELNKAIQRNPDSRPPRLHRGVVYWRMKKHNAALADFQAVLEPPDDRRLIEACCYRGQLYMQLGEHDKALSDFNRMAEASPRFRSVYLDRPMVFLASGDVPKTLSDLDAYINLTRKVDADGWEIHGLRGRILRFIHCRFLSISERDHWAARAQSRGVGTHESRAERWASLGAVRRPGRDVRACRAAA